MFLPNLKRILFLLIVSLAFTTSSFAQVAPNFNIYAFPTRFDVQAEDYFDNNGFSIRNIEVMTQGHIVYSTDKTRFNPESIKKYLGRYFPGSGNTGTVVLDWESGPYHDLRVYPASDYRFKAAEKTLIDLVTYVKKIRPSMKFSLYSLPYRTWNEWQRDNYNTPGKLDNLISRLDFITPSLYILYTDEEVGRERNLQYLRDNVEPALIIGKKYGKPVVPFVWHRVHFNSPKYGKQIMRKEVMASYIKYVKEYTYNNYKISGVTWWDDVSGRLENLKGMDGHLNGTVYDARTYDAMIVNFAKHIKSVLNNGSTSTAPSTGDAQVISYTLFDASTKKELQTISNGATINLGSLPTNKLNIRANTKGDMGSVKFYLSGTQTKSVTESAAPYDLMGDNGAWTPTTGSYTLKATPYSGSNASGSTGTSLTVNFTVSSSSSGSSSTGTKGESFTLVNADTEKDIMTISEGATINLESLSTTRVNIRFNKGSLDMASVKLVLSGAQSKSVVESIAPYALIGDNNNGNYYSWTPPTGSYTIKATPYSGTKASGTAGTSFSINFKVTNSYSASSSSNLAVDSTSLSFSATSGVVAYPNPATSLLNVEASDSGEGVSTIKLYDYNGKVVLTQEEKATASGLKAVVDISELQHGLYILEVVTPKGRSSQRVIKE